MLPLPPCWPWTALALDRRWRTPLSCFTLVRLIKPPHPFPSLPPPTLSSATSMPATARFDPGAPFKVKRSLIPCSTADFQPFLLPFVHGFHYVFFISFRFVSFSPFFFSHVYITLFSFTLSLHFVCFWVVYVLCPSLVFFYRLTSCACIVLLSMSSSLVLWRPSFRVS
ncbi:hypothetical protein BCR44DRAFT_1096795 [Catenaria anguillulae PL171]|uniref:Transmembrane protein n=1 Tax=Catenaria anguillulae PL171 TaxID=765915 RepID=A0A1Y2H8S0_9FUNG|nr:hypothetical protein BCR44DRAFT_1096795 [Catenaria anguillulae PL171]